MQFYLVLVDQRASH